MHSRLTRAEVSISRYLLIGLFFCLSLAVGFLSMESEVNAVLLVTAVLTAGYLALNIGANDAANSIGTTVGAGALTLGAALLVAAIGEFAGAFLASDLVSTQLREVLFHSSTTCDCPAFAGVLFSGMLAAALWLNLATVLRAPVSTTHSVIGGILGAGIFANGWSSAQWGQIGGFAVVWLITPIVAALTGGAVLQAIERAITFRPNLIGAARSRVPLLIALLAWLLSYYFMLDLAPSWWTLSDSPMLTSVGFAIVVFLIAQPLIHHEAQSIKNNRQGVNKLFTVPLVVAAGFFAFAHGANDMGNITAPLVTMTLLSGDGGEAAAVMIPIWILLIGGLGIVVGLLTYGNRLIRTVGSEITEIDKLRAFCIAFSAALVVLGATRFGYPVSTTHTLVGSIFGIGLLREFRRRNERQTLQRIRKCYDDKDGDSLESFLGRFQGATLQRKQEMLDSLYTQHGKVRLTKKELRQMDGIYNRELVKRTLFRRIIAFWLLTLPVTGLIGALLLMLSRSLFA